MVPLFCVMTNPQWKICLFFLEYENSQQVKAIETEQERIEGTPTSI